MVTGPAGPVTRGMRRMLWVAAGLVLVQGSILLAAHDDTSRYFSWTIAVPVTAAFLGASYLAAAVLEAMAARQGSWQQARIAVPGVLAFTTLTLAVTLVHLDKFHLSVASVLTRALTWGWLAIYVGVPPVLAFLWWRQAQAVPGPEPAGTPLPPVVRAALGVQGAVMLALGVALLAAPVQVARLWPWPLTALTGGAVGAWLVGLGIIAAQSWHADRRDVVAIVFPANIVYGALQLAVLAVFAHTMHWDQALAWCYLLFLASLLAVGIAGLTAVTRNGLPHYRCVRDTWSPVTKQVTTIRHRPTQPDTDILPTCGNSPQLDAVKRNRHAPIVLAPVFGCTVCLAGGVGRVMVPRVLGRATAPTAPAGMHLGEGVAAADGILDASAVSAGQRS
jgi:hypothetical protein